MSLQINVTFRNRAGEYVSPIDDQGKLSSRIHAISIMIHHEHIDRIAERLISTLDKLQILIDGYRFRHNL